MSRKHLPRWIPFCFLLLGSVTRGQTYEGLTVVEEPQPAVQEHGMALGLPSSRWGIGFGNGSTFTGVRLNFRDAQVHRVTGLNLTLGRPGSNPAAVLRGVSFGLVGTSARRMDGMSLNLLGAGVDRGRGLIGSVGLTSGYELRGVGFGLLTSSFFDTQGISLAALNVQGVSLQGLMVGGVSVAGQSIRGLAVAGVAVMGQEISGIGVGGSIVGQRIRGLHVGVGLLRSKEFSGVGVGLVHICQGRMRGVSIALFNQAESLQGVQIGLLNRVGTGPSSARWLPLVNARF